MHPSCTRSLDTHRSLAMGSNFKPCSFLYPLGFGYLEERLCAVSSAHTEAGSSENVGYFPLMPAADASQVNKPHGAQPQTRTNKLIREATGRGEVKAALCLEERK